MALEPEERYRLLAENASDVVLLTGPDRQLSWISPSVTDALGWKPEELIGTSGFEFVHPDDQAVWKVAQESVYGDGHPSQAVAVRCCTKAGDYHWISGSANPIFDDGGVFQGVVFGLRNIDDLVAAQEASEKDRKLLAATLNSLLDSNVVLEAVRDEFGAIVDFVYTLVNDAACAHDHLSREELVGARLLEVAPSDLSSGLFDHYVRTVETGTPLVLDDFVYRDERHGFEPRHIDIRGSKVDNGLSLTWRDSTERYEWLESYRLLAENASDVVFWSNSDGVLEWISKSVVDALGWQPEQIVGHSYVEFAHSGDMATWDLIAGQGDALGIGTHEGRLLDASGRYHWFALVFRSLKNDDGDVIARIGNIRNIDDKIAAQEALEDSEARYRFLIENVSDVVMRTNLDAVIEWVSPSVTDLTGLEPDEFVGRRLVDYVYPGDRSGMEISAAELINGKSVVWEGRLNAEGEPGRWVSVAAGPIFADDGATIGSVLSIRDVHEEVMAREALVESEERFRLAMDSAPIGMAVVDLERRFVEVNPVLCEMVGRSEEWLTSHRVPDILDPDDDSLDLHMRALALSGGASSITRERCFVRSDGSQIWVEHSIGLLRDKTGLPLSYVSTFVDITESKLARESLKYQATHDMLTHLSNRRNLFEQANLLLTRTPRTGTLVAVLFIDLDSLKTINDLYGHAAGDQALIRVANSLTKDRRADDVVSRIGGDEFVVLLPGLHSVSDAEAAATRILSAANGSIDVDGIDVPVSISIGVALADPKKGADESLQHADSALYQAKENGRARFATYSLDKDS